MDLYNKYPEIPQDIIKKITDYSLQFLGLIPQSIDYVYYGQISNLPLVSEGYYFLIGGVTGLISVGGAFNAGLFDLDTNNIVQTNISFSPSGTSVFIDKYPVIANNFSGIGFSGFTFEGYMIKF